MPPPAAPFSPAPWLRGPHAQTIGARALRARIGGATWRERLTLPDGDFLDLDWHAPGPGEAPLAVILHGLEGSARSGYVRSLSHELARRKTAAVGLNFRSCSGELNRAARLYHSGETADLRFVLETLAARDPRRPLGAIGVSLGGNVLLKYLGEEGRAGRRGPLAAAAAVSVPFDLSAGADALEHGFARVYAWRLLRSLKRKVRAKARQLVDRIDLDRTLAARTFREFDDAATAPLHGFANADDYYRRSSSRAFLAAIGIPVRLIQSTDDPFLPASAVPWTEARGNVHLEALFTDRGGHVGFVSGRLRAPRFWAEERAAEFLVRHLAGETI